MNFIRGVCVFAVMYAFVSCDAPRINPLDPESPDYNYSTIEGTVKTQSLQLPMEGVRISWKNQNVVVYTNSVGKFAISKIDRIDGWIYFEKDGYSKDSSMIQIGTLKNITADKTLNALPRLDGLTLFTSILNSYPAEQSDTLFVSVKVSDAENDIDSVMISNKSISLNQKLIYNSVSKYYERKYEATKLNISSLDKLIGTTFDFVAIDKNKKEFLVGSSNVKRVITQQITCRSPLNRESVGSIPVLEWNRFTPGFNFTYMVQIISENLDQLVWQKENISQDLVNVRSDIKLPSGIYYWVVWCVDEFQNKSRSYPATFIIP
jgi:hypothetical protein